MKNQNKKYNLNEKNRRRMNEIFGKAMWIGTVMYTEDEKKAVDQKTLASIIRNAALIRSIAWDIAHDLGLEILEYMPEDK